MSNIDKRADSVSRIIADLKLKHGSGDTYAPIMRWDELLSLLDELEAKDSMIAAQQHEIRTLLNALEGRPCPKCNDTGMADSGGTQPWGEPISVPCDCAAPPAPVSVPDAMEMDDDFDSAFEHGKAVGWNACRAAILQRAEPVQGWIPCSDRMPTKNHRVLIFINFNSDTVPPSIHDAQFTGSTFRRGNATVNVFPLEDGYGVTHWMPLPAAPQQGA